MDRPSRLAPRLDGRGAPGVGAGREAVRCRTLSNGVKIIVWPSRAIPNVALSIWVRAGSRNEIEGATGLAHFFEHMMFNGTARYGPGQFDRLMEDRGAASNAFTSEDVTVYQDSLPRGALELAFELEADRLANLSFVPEIVECERRVVWSERQLCVDDNGAGLLAERVQATAFLVHPYRFPTIGQPADIKAWRMEDLRGFFRTYYAPCNQTFVLAGDVEPEEAFALARRYLGPIAPRDPPPRVRVREPAQLGERRVTLRRKGRTPLLQLAYKAPAAGDARAPALQLLVRLLVEGDASRLHRTLVERARLAVEVAGDWHEGFDPGLLWLHLTLPEGGDPAAALRALDREIARIVERGIARSELERAQSLALAAHYRQLAANEGKAHLLGEYAVMSGNWRGLSVAAARYAAVSCAEVQAIARAVLDPRRRTVGTLVPIRAPR